MWQNKTDLEIFGRALLVQRTRRLHEIQNLALLHAIGKPRR